MQLVNETVSDVKENDQEEHVSRKRRHSETSKIDAMEQSANIEEDEDPFDCLMDGNEDEDQMLNNALDATMMIDEFDLEMTDDNQIYYTL